MLANLFARRFLLYEIILIQCEHIIRKIAIKRYGAAGEILPVIGNRFWRNDEIKRKFSKMQEDIQLLEKPEIEFKFYERRTIS